MVHFDIRGNVFKGLREIQRGSKELRVKGQRVVRSHDLLFIGAFVLPLWEQDDQKRAHCLVIQRHFQSQIGGLAAVNFKS